MGDNAGYPPITAEQVIDQNKAATAIALDAAKKFQEAAVGFAIARTVIFGAMGVGLLYWLYGRTKPKRRRR
jgi:hypothetical protein